MFKSFQNNYFISIDEKYHLQTTSKSEVDIKISKKFIKSKNRTKRLGVNIGGRLTLINILKSSVKKTCKKLHALSRVSENMDPNKRRILVKSLITSHFGCFIVETWKTESIESMKEL